MLRREGISQSVVTDVIKIFRGKTVRELEALQRQIETKINSGEEGIDIGYWESLLSQLKGKINLFFHFRASQYLWEVISGARIDSTKTAFYKRV